MAQVRWTPQALEDLDAVCLFIARDAPQVAAVFADRAFRATDRLVDHPRLGRIVPELEIEAIAQSELFREALRFYLIARPLPLPNLTRPRRIPKGQAWFWTKAWLEGEKKANEAIRLGRLYGPFSTPKVTV